MWSFQNLLFTLCIVLSHVASAAEVIHVSGYEGREAKVSCHYKEDIKSRVKYLCRNDCKEDPDVLITTTIGKRSRYSISDDKRKRVFTAIISDLSFTDAGKYWCGVDIFGIDIFTEVKLDVKQDHCCEHFTKVQGYEDSSVSVSCPYESEDRNNLKYICRGNKPSTCLQEAVVASDIKPNGQFSFKDDKTSRKFTVTITSLAQKDSGMYLCGVQRNTGLDVFSGIKLEVKVLPQQTSTLEPVGSQVTQISGGPIKVFPQQTSTLEPVGSQVTQMSGGPIKDAALIRTVVVLLFLTLALVVLLKDKCYKVLGIYINRTTQTAEAEEVKSEGNDYEYQEVMVSSQQRTSNQHSTWHQRDEDAGEGQ